MRSIDGRSAPPLAAAAVSLLVFAPAALADSIRYDVEASGAYTVEQQGEGVVQVTYNGCVTAGVRNVLGLRVITEVSRDTQATWNVLKDEGEQPRMVFDPSTVFLRAGDEQTTNVRLGFTLDEPSEGQTAFRFKLDPEEGSGVGESAGVLVRIPCVVARQAMPAPGSTEARQNAPCIEIVSRRGRRAGQLHRIRVRIAQGDRNVQGATVRIRGAGVSARRRTNGSGETVLRVRPKRAGVLVVQTNVCEGSQRLRVLGARRISFTG